MSSDPYRLLPDRVLFVKTAWHSDYGMGDSSDAPSGGGASGAKKSDGELENFRVADNGKCLGLIQARGINVQRLGAERGASFQYGVLVVSVAPHPDGRGQVIVGWQTSCIVHAERRKHGAREYNYTCAPESRHVVPVEERTQVVPRGTGGMGQTMFTYGRDAQGDPRTEPWVSEAVTYVGERLPTA